MRMLCLSTTVSGLLIFGAGAVYAQDQEHKIDTLREAISVGVSTNPEYGMVAASRRATDEELNQGKALFLPSIDLSGDVGYEYSDDPSTRVRIGDGDEEFLRRQIGVTLTQMLFDGFDAHYEVQRQKARVVSSAKRVRETSELVALSIVESYLEVMRRRQLLMISRGNIAEHVKILEQIKDSIEAGRSTKADGEQAKARLASARATEASALEALRSAEADYREVVGDTAGELKLPIVPYEVLEEDVDQQAKVTLAKSPTLDIYEADIKVAYAEAEQTKSTQYPQFDLQFNARTGEDLGGTEGEDTSASALVVLNWNLYRGGADLARAREFVHRHQQAKEERTEAERSIEKDVRRTWASMVAAGQRAAEYASQSAANTEVVKAYQDQFNIDRRTLLDVLDSQNELFVSRSNTVNSEFLEMLAVYRLVALKGSLLPSLGVEYPRESVIASGAEWSYEEQQKAR
ncbi:MAG: TolC family outer membrane protein [Alphaproteobacteria bacterium]|nr:TolC family outer membrane protein [Alphaproteobacteria bacterium]